MSYHPGSQSASYFNIEYDASLTSILVACLKSLRDKVSLKDKWEPTDTDLVTLWHANEHIIPTFNSLAPLRRLLQKRVVGINPHDSVMIWESAVVVSLGPVHCMSFKYLAFSVKHCGATLFICCDRWLIVHLLWIQTYYLTMLVTHECKCYLLLYPGLVTDAWCNKYC